MISIIVGFNIFCSENFNSILFRNKKNKLVRYFTDLLFFKQEFVPMLRSSINYYMKLKPSPLFNLDKVKKKLKLFHIIIDFLNKTKNKIIFIFVTKHLLFFICILSLL